MEEYNIIAAHPYCLVAYFSLSLCLPACSRSSPFFATNELAVQYATLHSHVYLCLGARLPWLFSFVVSLRAWVLPMLIIQVHQSFPNASLQEPRWCYLSAFDSLQVSHHRRQSHVIQSVYPSMRGAQLITVVVMVRH